MREHGTYALYKLDGCRCYRCSFEVSAYNERRERAIAYGTWQPFVDAEPVREHLVRLRECGLGTRRVAALTGLQRSVLIALLNGRPRREPSRRVRPGTAARILAVEPTIDNIAPSTPVDVTGTRRRLQALVALGWSQAKLTGRLGTHPGSLHQLLTRAQQVSAGKARAVRNLYDELWNQGPPQQEHRDKIAANRARRYARELGWAPPMAWDDDTIDDPAARPRGVRAATA